MHTGKQCQVIGPVYTSTYVPVNQGSLVCSNRLVLQKKSVPAPVKTSETLCSSFYSAILVLPNYLPFLATHHYLFQWIKGKLLVKLFSRSFS